MTSYSHSIVTLALACTVSDLMGDITAIAALAELRGCSNLSEQKSHAVAGKPRDAAVNSDRYRVRWHFAGAISVSRMQSVSGCTVYA